MNRAKTVQESFVRAVVQRVATPELATRVEARTDSLVESAVPLNERGWLVQLYGLTAPTMRWCSAALDCVGDTTRAQLVRKANVADSDMAAVIEANLGQYAENVGELPPVPPVDLRPRAKAVLNNARHLLGAVATGEPRLHDIDWDECEAAIGHAASALVGVYDMGLLHGGLPSETLIALRAMDQAML
jgi:hypothetical protein